MFNTCLMKFTCIYRILCVLFWYICRFMICLYFCFGFKNKHRKRTMKNYCHIIMQYNKRVVVCRKEFYFWYDMFGFLKFNVRRWFVLLVKYTNAPDLSWIRFEFLTFCKKNEKSVVTPKDDESKFQIIYNFAFKFRPSIISSRAFKLTR